MAEKKTHEQFVEEMKIKKSNIEVIGFYIGAREKVECKCKICGTIWQPIASNVLRHRGCPKCGGSMKLTHDEFVNRVY